MTISERIFELMKERHLSQKVFSELTGISYSTISDWKRKNNNPASDKIMVICNVLQVTPEFLLDDDSDKTMSDDPFIHKWNIDTQELRLIEFYRGLSSDSRTLLWAYMEALSKINNPSENNSDNKSENPA